MLRVPDIPPRRSCCETILKSCGHLLESKRSPAITHILKTYGKSEDSLLKSDLVLKQGPSGKRRWMATHKDGKDFDGYADDQVMSATKAKAYFDAVIVESKPGEIVRNPTFVIGSLSIRQAEDVAKYLRLDRSPSELRITGRSIKHAYERRPDVVHAVIGDLSRMFTGNVIVLPNHKDKNKVILVCRSAKTSSNKNYVSAVEIGVAGDALYISSFMSMPDRTLRQAIELGANWQEGQRTPVGDYPHLVAPLGAHAEAGFSDVQPIGDSTIPNFTDKSTGKSFDELFDLLKSHIDAMRRVHARL